LAEARIMEEASTLLGTIDAELIPLAPDNARATVTAFLKHGHASLLIVMPKRKATELAACVSPVVPLVVEH
jgi:hypothetical protein